jgi:hypothetical protein
MSREGFMESVISILFAARGRLEDAKARGEDQGGSASCGYRAALWLQDMRLASVRGLIANWVVRARRSDATLVPRRASGAAMYILFNGLMMALELAAITGVVWVGYTAPLIFAGGTAVLALSVGAALEIARLKYEFPFYFERTPGRSMILIVAVGAIESITKAVLAGVVGLLTFLGTDHERLKIVAIVFGVCLFLGIQLVRMLMERLKARPLRWGYFRLAAPLGLMFSAGLTFLPAPGITELAKRAAFDLPARPSMEQASEFLFLLKQSFDEIVVRMLSWVFDPSLAQAIGAVVSVNMLSGFVLALYAVLIAEGIRTLEKRT